MAFRIATTLTPRHSVADVQNYLPANYTARRTSEGGVLIVGEDDHGWTLDGYVIPRLGSALIGAVEVMVTLQGQPVLVIGRRDLFEFGDEGRGVRLTCDLYGTDGAVVRGQADVSVRCDEAGVREPLGSALQDWISPDLLAAAEAAGVVPQLVAELLDCAGVPRIATLGAE